MLLSSDAAQRSLSSTAADLCERVGVSRLAVTGRRESVLAGGDGSFSVRTPYIEDAAEEGTFEDHFTAGLALGRIEGLSDESTLVLGSALSGYYQRHQQVPAFAELIEFLGAYREQGAS